MDVCPCCCGQSKDVSGFWKICECCQHRWRIGILDNIDVHYYERLEHRNNTESKHFKIKIQDRLNAVLALIKNNNTKILEIGCAEGVLGELVKQYREVVYDGIEISRDAQIAKNKLDHVFTSPAEQIKDVKYDLILSFHVLEHIQDIVNEIDRWRRLLTDNGQILIEVPNKAGHALLNHDCNPEHLHQFTMQSLACLLAHARLELISITTGHYESSVYNNSIRAVAKIAINDQQKGISLVNRFKSVMCGEFIVYGVGGDFNNYVIPIIKSLQVTDLLDSSPKQWGKEIAGFKVKKYDENVHSNKRILVASIRFQDEIIQQLMQLGVSRNYIKTLDEVYGEAK